ncbi:DNA-binding response regulator [Terrihabitans soli]|uniref:DNA-binding response regulator n=1 Tax=Terrihabitans soli TaxID=708113 RepID=A0A6S6QST2_9HYPH|nr:response regulator transcription factor [Terrihabitans soli]BCJ90121.1 DNA-binding response regulator [Terrihabitans soli]
MASALASVPDGAPHLLIVDDDARIRTLLARYLSEAGYRVTTAASADDARSRLKGLSFDLLILDVMMPGESGMDLAASLRKTSQVPILMLTALGDPKDRIKGLESGVDDYMSKPFEPRELLLRINGILRRTMSAASLPSETPEVTFGAFSFHLGRGELRDGDDILRITERERELLRLLAEQRGGAVSREALAGKSAANERAVDVQINRLRRKIEKDPSNPLLLQTVRGSGYRLLIDP